MSTPLPAKRSSDGRSRLPNASNSPVRRSLGFGSENTELPRAQHDTTTMLPMHPHESSRDYLLRIRERGGNGSREQWEDCRVLNKFMKKITKNGRDQVMCNIECRLRTDLEETSAWRPEAPIK